VTEPVFGATALGIARYHRRDEIAALLRRGSGEYPVS
jgi:hypothetical protein